MMVIENLEWLYLSHSLYERRSSLWTCKKFTAGTQDALWVDVCQQSVLHGSSWERSDGPTHGGAAIAAEGFGLCRSKL